MIYIHVPFCKSFCTYCDFYSETRVCEAGLYARDVIAEVQARREEILATSALDTIYIGGGTPSVLPPDVLKSIVDALPLRGKEEFTIEVNPEDIVTRGESYVKELLAMGVTRISMGVQSLDDALLRWMGRRHDSARAIQAATIIREAGVKNLSLDVIYGISHLGDETLASTLEGILALRPEHISAYQLSIESGSALARMVEDGRYTEADEEQCRRQYLLICQRLREAGYRHYEISNWALPGFEAVHNSAYWKRLPYVGLGPGAHSLRIGRAAAAKDGKSGYEQENSEKEADGREEVQVRSWNSETLSGWTAESETLNKEQIREEEIMLGLRTAEGTDIDGRHVKLSEEDWFIADSIIVNYL